MQIHTFLQAIKEMVPEQKFVWPIRYCNGRYTLDISYIFAYYSVYFDKCIEIHNLVIIFSGRILFSCT